MKFQIEQKNLFFNYKIGESVPITIVSDAKRIK
jgi:hypothetical protein